MGNSLGKEGSEFENIGVDAMPEVMQCEHILTGYRPLGLRWRTIVRTLFAEHNELINVWTHAVPIPFFAYGTLKWLLFRQPGWRSADRLAMGAYCVTHGLVFVASTSYHLFGCKSEQWFRRLRACDYTGIVLMIAGCYAPGVQLSLGQEHPLLSRRVLSTTAAAAVGICSFNIFAADTEENKLRVKVSVCAAAVHVSVCAVREGEPNTCPPACPCPAENVRGHRRGWHGRGAALLGPQPSPAGEPTHGQLPHLFGRDGLCHMGRRLRVVREPVAGVQVPW